MKSVAKEYGPTVTANVVCPGFIDTEMNDNLSAEEKQALAERVLLGRVGRPEEVAAAVWFAAESTYLTGTELNVDGGLKV